MSNRKRMSRSLAWSLLSPGSNPGCRKKNMAQEKGRVTWRLGVRIASSQVHSQNPDAGSDMNSWFPPGILLACSRGLGDARRQPRWQLAEVHRNRRQLRSVRRLGRFLRRIGMLHQATSTSAGPKFRASSPSWLCQKRHEPQYLHDLAVDTICFAA